MRSRGGAEEEQRRSRGAEEEQLALTGKHVVDAEVAGVVGHVVDAAVAEVAEDVRPVEPGHGDLAAAHLQEGREGAEDALLLRVHAEAGGRSEVPALHL